MAGTLRVLYVDDEPELLRIGKLFLEREGAFAVDTLTSAVQALEQLDLEQYDAIVSDYQMPDMDGIEFLRQLKNSGNTTPFIIFTGRGREEVVIDALNSGADFYLQKGGEPKAQFTELVHKIRSAVDRKRTEKLAKDTERRLYDIINFLPDATFAIDTRGTVIAWNRAIEEMTGVPAREMLGKGNYEYSIPFYGERRPILIDLVSVPCEELTRKGYAVNNIEGGILIAETRLPRPLGRYSVLLGKASLLYNDHGNSIGAIESIRDITDQKRTEEDLRKKNDELNASYEQIAAAEEELRGNLEEMTRGERALRESEEKFKTLFESAGDAILLMDQNVFLDCNRKAEELYHREKDQLTGHSPAEFSPEFQPDGTRSAEKMKGKIEAALIGENRLFEWVHLRQDGTPIIVEVRLNRFMVGNSYYLQAIVRDITERKQNEEQVAGLSGLKEKLLGRRSLQDQLKLVCDSCIEIFGADFSRIWLVKDADLCKIGCRHAPVTTGPDVCRDRSRCLHLMVSSGRYTHINGGHQRVPFGCYKIGRVASGEEDFFVSNDVVHDTRVHDHEWAQSLGLVSFAGFRLLSKEREPVGVLALFRDRAILPREEKLLVDLANTLSQVIISGNAEEALRVKNEELHASYEQIAATEEELRANLDEMIRQELAIRESEEKYQTVADFTYDWEFWIGPDGKFIYISPSCERITGYRPEEFMNDPGLLFAISHNDDRDNIIDHLTCREGQCNKKGTFEFRIISKSGEERWIGHESQPVFGPNREYRGIRGSNRDITERRQAEEHLVAILKRNRDQQAVLATISLSPHLLSGDVDSLSNELTEVSSGVLGVERASVWLFNSLGDELRCIDLYEVSHNRHSRGPVLKRHEYVNEFDALSTAKYIDAHDPLTDARTAGYVDGYLLPNHITSMLDAVIRVSGQNLGLLCFEHVDRSHYWESDEIAFACQLADQIAITLLNRDRKVAEDALRESEERYHNVVEDQTEFICRFLPDGTHIFVNDAYCRYFNKKREDIVGHRFRPEIHPDDRGLVARSLASLTPDHPHETIDHRIIMPDGSIRWQRWSDRAIFDQNSRVVEYQSVGRDITERKELEREMENREQELRQLSTSLAATNQKLTLLSGITRHDINNQLMVLQGYLGVLEQSPPGPEQQEYLLKATTAAQRISAMIRFAREYESIGAHAPSWQKCRTLVDTAAKDALLDQVILKNDLPPGTEIFADPLVEKVFYNLMDNAVRYGGKISTIRFSVGKSGDNLLIICEDDGEGIPAEIKEQIFERGYGKNTGLGLAISREIFTITGISIRENGEPGKGARFEIMVPKGTYR